MAARFRKIDPRIWTDEKFRKLTSDQQRIALYVLTAQSNRIGLFLFSPGKACEDLGTLPPTFQKGFRTVCQTLNWSWDTEARVLYLPTWWKYNHPENANNMIGNLKDFDDLPETPLLERFSSNTTYLSSSLAETFTQTLAKRYPQRSPKRSPSQEQEQEQEQESPRPPKGESASHSLNGHKSSFEIFWRAYPKKRGKGPAEKAWAKIKPDDMLLGTMLAKIDQAKQTSQWTKDRGEFIPHPATWLNAKGWEDEYETPGTLNTKPPADACTWRLDSNGRRSRTCGEPIAANQPHPIRPFCPQHLAERQRLDAKLQEANA